MLFSVEQAFVERDEKRDPLKTPAWEAKKPCDSYNFLRMVSQSLVDWYVTIFAH